MKTQNLMITDLPQDLFDLIFKTADVLEKDEKEIKYNKNRFKYVLKELNTFNKNKLLEIGRTYSFNSIWEDICTEYDELKDDYDGEYNEDIEEIIWNEITEKVNNIIDNQTNKEYNKEYVKLFFKDYKNHFQEEDEYYDMHYENSKNELQEQLEYLMICETGVFHPENDFFDGRGIRKLEEKMNKKYLNKMQYKIKNPLRNNIDEYGDKLENYSTDHRTIK